MPIVTILTLSAYQSLLLSCLPGWSYSQTWNVLKQAHASSLQLPHGIEEHTEHVTALGTALPKLLFTTDVCLSLRPLHILSGISTWVWTAAPHGQPLNFCCSLCPAALTHNAVSSGPQLPPPEGAASSCNQPPIQELRVWNMHVQS